MLLEDVSVNGGAAGTILCGFLEPAPAIGLGNAKWLDRRIGGIPAAGLFVRNTDAGFPVSPIARKLFNGTGELDFFKDLPPIIVAPGGSILWAHATVNTNLTLSARWREIPLTA